MAGGLLLSHLALAEERRVEVKIAAVCGAVGFVLDSAQALAGRLSFTGPFFASQAELAPLWVVMLWLQLGTTLRYSLSWLSQRYVLACLWGLPAEAPLWQVLLRSEHRRAPAAAAG